MEGDKQCEQMIVLVISMPRQIKNMIQNDAEMSFWHFQADSQSFVKIFLLFCALSELKLHQQSNFGHKATFFSWTIT